MEQTITEHDVDQEAQQFLDGLKQAGSSDPDLSIDGLSESLLSRLFRLFSSRHR